MNLDGLFEHFTEGTGTQGAIFFAIGLGVVIVLFVVLAILKDRVPALGETAVVSDEDGEAKSSQRRFSTIAFKLLARKCGLNSEQTKMLDYVFKLDGVTDPLKSMASSELLDKHFRRAFRSIEKNIDNDEEMQQRMAVLFSTRNALDNSIDNVDITSSDEIPDGVSVALSSGNEKHITKLISAKGNSFDVACPGAPDAMASKLPKGTKLDVLVTMRTGSNLTFKTKVIGIVEQSGVARLKLEHSDDVSYIFQRTNRRRDSAFPCNLYVVNTVDKKLVVDKKKAAGGITDISAGGCAVKTMAPIPSGTKLKIEFTQGKSATVAALGEVLRTDRVKSDTILNVKFLKITRKSLNIINAFVYDFNQ